MMVLRRLEFKFTCGLWRMTVRLPLSPAGVLVAGGGDVSAPTDSAEVFNPQTAGFSPVGTMTTARTMQSAILLPTGKVLITGGQSSERFRAPSRPYQTPKPQWQPTLGSVANSRALRLDGGTSNLVQAYAACRRSEKTHLITQPFVRTSFRLRNRLALGKAREVG